jgi:cytochrome c biogenesis protein ResB
MTVVVLVAHILVFGAFFGVAHVALVQGLAENVLRRGLGLEGFCASEPAVCVDPTIPGFTIFMGLQGDKAQPWVWVSSSIFFIAVLLPTAWYAWRVWVRR